LDVGGFGVGQEVVCVADGVEEVTGGEEEEMSREGVAQSVRNVAQTHVVFDEAV
jgi:hypothetical protein